MSDENVFVPSGQLPWRLSIEKLEAGGLWCSGSLDFSRPRIGIVGSRAGSRMACEFTRQLASELARKGVDVVSGGALGVDQAAHEGCLAGGGYTWLVSPTHIGAVSPKGQDELFARVRDRGIVVSQFDRESFEVSDRSMRPVAKARNKTLCALVDALVVIQGDRTSGTLHCAGQALERNVPCFIMTGPAWDPAFEGNRISARRPGARWIHSRDELWGALDLATADKLRGEPELSPEARSLLSILDAEPRHLDWICAESGLSMADLAPVLLTLSLEHVVKEGPSGFWAMGSRNPGNDA